MKDAIVKMIGGTIKALRRTVAGFPFLKIRAAKITMIEITRPKVESNNGKVTPAVRAASASPLVTSEVNFSIGIVKAIAIAETIAATIDS
ncbi:hypothetical protein D3C87_1523610 [compost metagenome]